MNDWIHVPGFPPPEKRDSVKFHFLKSISYSTRMLFYLLLVFLGFMIQFVLMSPWEGAIFLILATILNLVKGCDVRTEQKAFCEALDWTGVSIERLHEIIRHRKRIEKWDKDAIDISNTLGGTTFFLTALGLSVTALILSGFSTNIQVGGIFALDMLILILPLWFNGMRRIHNQSELCKKVDIIIDIEKYFNSIKGEREHFKPALLLAHDKSGKCIPKDARFSISFDDAPDSLYGIQSQINMNLVQDIAYPYFYCVIAAKPGTRLGRYVNEITRNRNIIIEFQVDKNAEVIVIRQRTTRQTGYHTKLNACRYIFAVSLNAVRMILNSGQLD